MISLRPAQNLSRLVAQSRHLATLPRTKPKKNGQIYEYNRQSLIVYGPLVGGKPRKRNYKPVHYRTAHSSQNLEFSDAEEEAVPEDLLPVLNVDCQGRRGTLDLNEMLAKPLIPGEGVDPELCRIFGKRSELEVKVNKMPSVTTILDKTMSAKNRMMLERWKKEQIELLGEEGFNQMQRETLGQGHQLHSAVQDFLQGQDETSLDLTPAMREGLWASVRAVLGEVGRVQFLEERLEHEELLYSGIVDCVAEYRDTVCVIDWKTSKKRKRTLKMAYDNPLQVAAYAGAVNSCRNMKMQNGLLVYAYPDGSPADVLSVPAPRMHQYWLLWLQRLQTYWRMTSLPDV